MASLPSFAGGRTTTRRPRSVPGVPGALMLGLSDREARDLADRIRRGQEIGSPAGGGFLGALARDFADTITALPAAGVLAGRTASTVFSGPLGIAAESGTPGLGWLRSYNRGTVDQVITAGRAIVEDYRYRYSPLVRGDTDTFGERFMEHPLGYLLDLGAAYSAIGKGASLAARGAGFGPRGRYTVPVGTGSRARRALSWLGDTDPGGRRRARPDREIFPPSSALGEGQEVLPIYRARRAASLNPITNALQQRLARRQDRRDLAFGRRDRMPQTIGNFVVPGSATARYNAAGGRLGQTVRMQGVDEGRRDYVETSRAYQRAQRKLAPFRTRIKGRQGYEPALYLHVTGLLDYRRLGFDSPLEALDGAIDFWEQGIRDVKRETPGIRTKASEKELEKWRALRDKPELLDIETAPPVLREVVEEARKVIREGQARIDAGNQRVGRASGLLTREQIEFARVRKARQAYGGSFQSDDLVDVNRRVGTPEGITTVRELEDRRLELLAEAQRIRKPAARREALEEVRAVERGVQQAVAAHLRGERDEARRLLNDARDRIERLGRQSEARLPGLGALARAEYPRERERLLSDDDIRARMAEVEGRMEALEARMAGARPDILSAGRGEIPESPIDLMMRELDVLPERKRSRSEQEAIRAAGGVDARLAELRAKAERGRAKDVAGDLADLMRYDLAKLRRMYREALNEAQVDETGKALRWARTVKEALDKSVQERLALATPETREVISELLARPEIGLARPEGELPIRRPDELRAARAEMAELQRQHALLRMSLEGTRPDDVEGLRMRAESLEREAADLEAIHLPYLTELARAKRDSYQPRKGERPKFKGDEQQRFKGDNEARSGRVRFNPEHFDREGRRLTLEQYRRDIEMEIRWNASQRGDADEATLQMLEDLDRVSELRAAAERDRAALREATVDPDKLDWMDDPGKVDAARAYLEREAQGRAILDAMNRLKDELAGELGDTFTEIVRMRQIRNRNASGFTGPDVRVPRKQRERGRRQAERMFGPGAQVPRSRTTPPDPAGMTPIEEAIADIGSAERQAWAALERLLPADLAREHRRVIAEVHQALGAARASFGGTPAEMADVMAKLRAVRTALKIARKKSTGGWTTPRAVEALHASIPQTGEMAEALAGLDRLRQQRADVVDRLLELQARDGADADPDADITPGDEATQLLRVKARLDARIRRAEVAYRELETEEAIKLYGEFGDPNGDYWPDRPRKGQSPKESRDDRGGRPRPQNRVTAERVQQNTGALFRAFNVSTSRRDPLNVLMRGVRAQHSADALLNLMERAGVRWAADQFDDDGLQVGKRGDLIRGRKTVELMKASPDLFRAIHLPSVSNVLERFRKETPDGEFPDQSILEAVFYKEADAATIEDALRRGDWKADDVVLLPRAAVDEYVDAAHGIFRGYDNALGVWKAGVLVFTPRWYIYNLVGNSLQYGLLSGGDIRSVLLAGLGKYLHPTAAGRARYRDIEERISRTVPEEVASVSQASEFGIAEGAEKIGRVADRLFEFNQTLEALIRRAAYINSAKRQLRYIGERKRTRSAEELIDALDELPMAAKEEALREALLFMGDYRRFNRFERGFVRRVIPFYSWLRVIHRLTLSLPFRSPLRAQVLALAAEAAQAQWDPLEEVLELGRPMFARGALEIPEGVPVVGGMTLPTNQLNPFATTTEYVPEVLEAAGREGPSAALGEAVQNLASGLGPGFVPIIEAATPGYQVFGNRAVAAPAGYGGIISSFGGRSLEPAGRGFEPTSGPEIPFLENLLQSALPYYGSAARQFAAGNRRVFDTATLPSIVAARLGLSGRIPGVYDARPGQVFRTPNPAYPPINPPSFPLTPIGALLGFPVRERDQAAEIQARLREIEERIEAMRQTQRRVARSNALAAP